MANNEIKDLLEKADGVLAYITVGTAGRVGTSRKFIQQALTKLQEKLKPIEFTIKLRSFIALGDAIDQQNSESSHPLIKPALEACDIIEHLTAEIKQLQEKPKDPWIPVSERLPEEHERKVICTNGIDVFMMFHTGGDRFEMRSAQIVCGDIVVTHWQPIVLPQASPCSTCGGSGLRRLGTGGILHNIHVIDQPCLACKGTGIAPDCTEKGDKR